MILALVLGGMLSAQAQHVQESKFCSPFDFPILLSANFGELRPNHFHNGLDIKTQGVTGKPIHCIADGYVSRVAVLHGGYGQAIYVTHPNGLTSVYGHVISFAKNIQACVRQYQYAHETFVCDLKFQPGQFPVKKGDIIALSGNEGASAGPHLHLELRRTETGEYIDPMPYFKHLLKDSKAPVGSLIGIYPIQGKGVVNGSSHKKLLAIGNLKQPVHAWGEIYTGISAKDYMDGTSNFYGVHSVTLYVDSVQVFNSTTDKVLPDENRMINGFTDYEELTRTRRLIMRSYKLPGNRLRLLHTNENRGAVTIDEEKDYHFRYVLEDNFGNRRTYQFIVRVNGRIFLNTSRKPMKCFTGTGPTSFRNRVWNWWCHAIMCTRMFRSARTCGETVHTSPLTTYWMPDEHPFTATATCPSACATCPWPTPRNTTSCRKPENGEVPWEENTPTDG